MIVTIDGPAGTGKSSVARLLAERLGFAFLDTGAMYRGVALACLDAGVDPADPDAVATLLPNCEPTALDGRATLDGVDVSERIRDERVTRVASVAATHPAVRAHLVDRQRQVARGRDLVTEGRDQGTIVFPQAEHKFFLDATVEERARRRFAQLNSEDATVTLEGLRREIAERDDRDRNRSVAPLRPAEDALVVDTTSLSLEEVVARLESVVRGGRGSV